jgi:hypothetical protein
MYARLFHKREGSRVTGPHRETMDELLSRGGWVVHDRDEAHITVNRDAIFYADCKTAGGIDTEPAAPTLLGIEPQPAKSGTYIDRPAHHRLSKRPQVGR